MHVDQDERQSLALRQPGQRLLDVQAHVDGVVVVAGLGRVVVIEVDGGTLPAQPVQARVHGDPVQPGGHLRVTAEGPGPAEGVEEGVLDGVGGELGVTGRAQGDRPHTVTVPAEDLPERLGVPLLVTAQQAEVVDLGQVRRHR